MGELQASTGLLGAVAYELLLFAAVGFLIGGIDDLAVDLAWIAHRARRALTVYRLHARGTVASLAPPRSPGRLIVFVPAWDEGAVIGPMLRAALARFDHADYRIYVGAYPNDPDTIGAVDVVAAEDARVRRVLVGQPGPTTKADCLNALWHAVLDDEAREGWQAKAIILHDAEDVVHSAELRVFDTLIERFEFVQLPVLPLVDRGSRWVSGHYLDEFAEAHGKTLVMREAFGAAVPAAGVGCAFARDVLARLAARAGGLPFDADSLTEDYELGLSIAEWGGRGIFVRMATEAGGKPVAIRAHFPSSIDAAVRQKARWIAGIALAGWDRLGWRGGWAERWMRLRDRRAPIAALITLAAYAGLVLGACAVALGWMTDSPLQRPSGAMNILLAISAAMLVWRLAMRAGFVTRSYGWREGLRSIPRALLANVIAMAAARRAVSLYWSSRKGAMRWEKTRHSFPETLPAE